MRILGGRWSGVSLVSPGGRVRPTSEGMRSILFECLESDIEGARVLDLFAGTGSLGLEALSRGAASVDFVENGPEALHALKANRAKLRATRSTRLFKREVFAFLGSLEGRAYDLALADPPYTSRAAGRLVSLWQASPFSTILSVEHPRDVTMQRGGVRRVFEDSAVTIYRLARTRTKDRS